MDLVKLTDHQKEIRRLIRSFLLTATVVEMEQEKVISLERDDKFRADVIQELIDSEAAVLLFAKLTGGQGDPG